VNIPERENHPGGGIPRLVITEENEALSRLLLEGQHVLLRYPQAARALVQAFVNEGRQFAGTPEGQAWQRQLAGSDLVRRSRFIWDAYSMDALLDEESEQIPSAWLDVIMAAVASPNLEMILANLVVDEVRNGNLGPV
jgi:hypothetical protein